MLGKTIALLAGLSLGMAPALASAPPSAQALSVQPALIERAGAPGDDASQLEGGAFIPALVALAIVAGGVLLAAGVFDNNNDSPTSP